MEESHTPNTHSHHNSKERTRKSPHPIPEVKIQIDCSSRTSSSHNHRGASSDGTLTENSSSETPWNREAKRTKIFHPKPPRKAKELYPESSHSSHSFLTDVADMRSMETALIQLVNDFHSGKLQAFGRHCSTDQMEAIRDQQEKLARLHFELGAQHDVNAQQTSDNMNELVSALEHLSQTIEQLHPHSSQSQSDSN
ncbi:coiled-coil domain-containing protein 28A-like isoform X1 [Daphnia pulex]|uniref:coiled-coil domain-containing protein 28A-like isoform X1 n=1 Tax=Daphnia pulex TaxID=6669 RepID=UPI001EE08F12|nr:coiled-coil domain-containing protein 28A-like isoform X1 [Daphnia pulex]XP_046446721.1 coiled-coil domain-containing protein 28A-like isoform X1 [Daphnia pulex]